MWNMSCISVDVSRSILSISTMILLKSVHSLILSAISCLISARPFLDFAKKARFVPIDFAISATVILRNGTPTLIRRP